MSRDFTTLDTIRDRLRALRKYRGVAQEEIASWLGISKQAWGKKERGEINGFSPEDFKIILENTAIDARWLFGQLGDTPIEQADLRISKTTSVDQNTISEMLEEYKHLKEGYKDRDSMTERLQQDHELRKCVDLLIMHRGQVGRVIGYIDRINEEKGNFDSAAAEKREAFGA